MLDVMNNDSNETQDLESRASAGDPRALEQLLPLYRDRLRQMIQFRLDPRLKSRLDSSDVLQDAFIEVLKRYPEYVREPKMSLFLWVRFIAKQKLLALHREHIDTQGRDMRREVSLFNGPLPGATSACLAAQLMGEVSSPSRASMRAEMKIQLQEALNSMDSMDREVLALRHFEHLDNVEVAEVLEISPSGASSRYIRALKRLRQILDSIPGFFAN